MAKHQRGRPSGKRGPYKTENDVSDPDQLGTGGIRLRQHRLAKMWTVEVMADRAGISQGTVSGIENGDSGYSHLTLMKLARALETTVGALFDVDPRADSGVEIWPLWQAADEAEKQRIISYAEGVVGGKRR